MSWLLLIAPFYHNGLLDGCHGNKRQVSELRVWMDLFTSSEFPLLMWRRLTLGSRASSWVDSPHTLYTTPHFYTSFTFSCTKRIADLRDLHGKLHSVWVTLLVPISVFSKWKPILNFVPHEESTYQKLEPEMVWAKARFPQNWTKTLGSSSPNKESPLLLLEFHC